MLDYSSSNDEVQLNQSDNTNDLRHFSFSFFRSNKSKTVDKVVSLTWPECVEKFAGITPEQTEDKHSAEAWSPATFRNGRRTDRDVETINALVLDFDYSTNEDRKAFRQRLIKRGLGAILHGSHGDMEARKKGRRKFRAIIPLSRPIPAADWERFWKAATNALAPGQVDATCKNPGRIYYVPSCPQGQADEHYAESIEGGPLDVDTLLEDAGNDPNSAPAERKPVRKEARGHEVTAQQFRVHARGRAKHDPVWQAVLDGEAFATDGDRDETLTKLCGEAAKVWPLADPASVARHFAPSMAEIAAYDRDQGNPVYDSDAVADRIARFQEQDGGNQPSVILEPGNLAAVVEQAEEVLGSHPDVYRRGTALVQVAERVEPPKSLQRDPDAPSIMTLNKHAVRVHLAERARWFRPGKSGPVPADPPISLAQDILGVPRWRRFRPLEIVTETPALLRDGRVIDTPGYDPDSGVLYQPTAEYPPMPTGTREAIATLGEVFEDFPFASPAHRAAAFAAVLTPVARLAFRGPAPLFLFDAPTQGTGKTKLATIAGMIATGRTPPVGDYTPDIQEMEKRIGAWLMAGDPVVLLDNVTARLGNTALARVLTATEWTGRVLGESRNWAGPALATWYATSNNATITADQVRRTLPIRLEASEEHPEQRTGFRHPELEAWVAEHRPRLAVAAIAILKRYIDAGRPDCYRRA